MGVIHCFSQTGTGCIRCLRAASVVAALTPILRRVDMIEALYIQLGDKSQVEMIRECSVLELD